MRYAFVLAGGALAMLGAPALAAQGQSGGAKDGVDDYLCTFAGKCGGTAAAATPTIPAPATKGFRLAAPQRSVAAQPTIAAPRSARLVTPAATAPAVGTAGRSRRAASVAHVVPPAAMPPAGTRANLRLAFGYNSDRLTPDAQARARTFAQALATPELRDKRFLIEGHTDSRGPRELNVDLSRRRAQAVADFLAKQGVEGGRVEVKGVGPDEPLPGQAPSAEANRRVEAVLLS